MNKKQEKKINKEIDKVRDSLIDGWFERHGTYRIGFKFKTAGFNLKTGRVIYQDIRDMVA